MIPFTTHEVSRIVTFIDTESEILVSRGWGRCRNWKYCLKHGVKLIFTRATSAFAVAKCNFKSLTVKE